MFSSSSYAGWTKVAESVNGDTFYVDYERIRKHDGYVYWWQLHDYLKPELTEILSSKLYLQGDCKLFRVKILGDSHYIEPMGRGTPSNSSNNPDKEWRYPLPSSSNETVLKQVCNR